MEGATRYSLASQMGLVINVFNLHFSTGVSDINVLYSKPRFTEAELESPNPKSADTLNRLYRVHGPRNRVKRHGRYWWDPAP